MNKVFIAGGTGFIGYHSALLFKSLNYEVVSFTLKENVNNLDTSFMKLYVGNLFEMEEKEIIDIFNSEKPDIFIYALGPDERVIPKAPAWNFFYEKLVIQAKKICMAAKMANIAKCVVLNSYFSYFDRLYNNKLSKTHPYIKARVYQEKEILKLKDDNFSVVFLELPYIFGTINNQTPLWKDSFLAPFDNYKSIMFPGKGGTAVIDISGVAQAVVAAAIYGENGKCYPINSDNLSFEKIIKLMLDAKKDSRKYKRIPIFFAYLFGKHLDKKLKKEGKEAGLNHAKLMYQIQSKKFYLDPKKTQEDLSFSKLGFDGGKDIKDSIYETIKKCYFN